MVDALLEAYFRQIERPEVQERNAKSVIHWVRDNKPLVASESTFLGNWRDLVAPAVPPTRTVAESVVESFAALLHTNGFSSVRS